MRKKKNTGMEILEENVLAEEKGTDLTPKEYFDILKGSAEKADEEQIQVLLNNAVKLINKYRITGQKEGAKKLYNFALLCEKELKAVKYGITEYITRYTLDEYITKIATKDVVICKLEDYERDIPDDVVDKIAVVKEQNLFDDYYVVFTDYTGGERKKIDKKRKEKDPILLGAHRIGNQINTRLYHIASWEDEYCDLTLEKMVKEYKDNGKESPVKNVKESYQSLEELKEEYNKSEKSNSAWEWENN